MPVETPVNQIERQIRAYFTLFYSRQFLNALDGCQAGLGKNVPHACERFI